MQHGVYIFFISLFDVGVSFKDLELVKSRSFEMNQ